MVYFAHQRRGSQSADGPDETRREQRELQFERFVDTATGELGVSEVTRRKDHPGEPPEGVVISALVPDVVGSVVMDPVEIVFRLALVRLRRTVSLSHTTRRQSRPIGNTS